jgi:uncharacterized SAM-binding protein YcdF (DUF218 family)
MIVRFFSLLILLYLLGFLLFSVTLGNPAERQRTDAAVVLTGGPGRIEYAMDVLSRKDTERLLIAGADPSVTKPDIIERLGGQANLVDCCVDLGSESVDTRSNAEEAKRWLDRRGYESLRLITSDWHMRRARYEFGRVLGSKYEIVHDSVPTEPRFRTLFAEYNDYLFRRIAVLLEI